MTRQNKTRLRDIGLIVSTVMSSAAAGYIVFRFSRSRAADARTFEMLWLAICVFSLVTGLVCFLRRNKRNTFDEEMAHRRSLVRDDAYHSHLKG
jgi:hypothetical protein